MKKITRFVSIAMTSATLLSAPGAFAAFTGDTTIVVNGSTTVVDGLNAGVQFAQPNPGNMFDGYVFSASGDLASDFGGSAVPTGWDGFSGFLGAALGDPINSDSNPFSNLDVASVAVGDTLMSFGDVLLTFDSLIAVVPNSGVNSNGSVDYAGMGTMTYLGGEATDVFWHYNVDGSSVGIVLDAQGVSSPFNTFSATAVPVPAAAWLFGSALAGMLGVRRLKS